MYGESLVPERKLMKRGSWVEMLRVESVSPRFMSPRVCDTHIYRSFLSFHIFLPQEFVSQSGLLVIVVRLFF